MAVFGPAWDDHVARLAGNWRDAVGDDDIVLVPGDVSWAMRLSDASVDLAWLAELPGRKVLVRGNHDYWWSSLGKMRALGFPGLYFVHNNHVVLDGIAIGGSRLWDFPFVRWGAGPTVEGSPAGKGSAERADDPEKIRAHELERLKLSLSGLPIDARYRVCMTHYPPLGEDGLPTVLTDCIGEYDIDLAVFGHIHAPSAESRPGEDCVIGKTRYVLASSDHVAHTPIMLAEFASNP